MSAAIKRLREQAKKQSPSDALSEWTVPVLPSDLTKLLVHFDALGLAFARVTKAVDKQMKSFQ